MPPTVCAIVEIGSRVRLVWRHVALPACPAWAVKHLFLINWGIPDPTVFAWQTPLSQLLGLGFAAGEIELGGAEHFMASPAVGWPILIAVGALVASLIYARKHKAGSTEQGAPSAKNGEGGREKGEEIACTTPINPLLSSLSRPSSLGRGALFVAPLLTIFLLAIVLAWTPFDFWVWVPRPFNQVLFPVRFLAYATWSGTLLFAIVVGRMFAWKLDIRHVVVGIALIGALHRGYVNPESARPPIIKVADIVARPDCDALSKDFLGSSGPDAQPAAEPSRTIAALARGRLVGGRPGIQLCHRGDAVG